MADEDVVSSPSSDQASTQTEGPGMGLANALNKAFDEVGLGEEKKEPEAPVEQPAGEEPKAKEPEPGKPKEVPQEAPTTAPKAAAPVQWDAASKAKFDKLPDAAKSIVLDLAKFQERDYTKKTQELANERRFAQSVMSLITNEHREQLRAQGLNEVQGFERLLQYQDYALRQPVDYVRWFVNAANLQPEAIFPELAGARPAPTTTQMGALQGQPPRTNGAIDPNLVKLREDLRQVTDWVNQSHQERTRELQERQQQGERQAMSVIDRFRAAADDGGQPLHPYFSRVEDTMTEILQTRRSINKIEDLTERLQAAYDAAIAEDKELRKEAATALAAQQRTAEQRQKDVAKAKAAVPPINATAQVSEGNSRGIPLKDRVAESMKAVGL